MSSSPNSESSPHGSFALLRDLVHERTGLYFHASKADLLLEKISPLIAQSASDSLLDYYYLLKYDAESVKEWPKVFDALTVQESYFWREMDQIDVLVDEIVPRYFRENPGRTLDIWSAACAAGEEPLTIAIALHEGGWFDRASIKIHASDASPRAIEGARHGIYRERSFRSLPAALKEKYFVRTGEDFRVSRELHSRVRWKNTNIMSEEDLAAAPTSSPIIFCRNVFIYFSESAARKTVHVFAERMQEPALLFLGAAESLMQIPSPFEPREIGAAFLYSRRAG